MKVILKRFIFMIMVWASVLSFRTSSFAALENWQLPEDIADLQVKMPEITLFADFYFLDKKIEFTNRPMLMTGRIYVPLNETVEAMGGSVAEDGYGFTVRLETGDVYISKTDDDKYPKRTAEVYGTTYVSLINLLAGSGYCPVFNTGLNRVDIYISQSSIAYNTLPQAGQKAAYLRLEDIMADGTDPSGGDYDDEGLEKLRAVADYLYKNGQKFYIAWIPLYTNPNNNTVNNLITDCNLYNASFLYTLDYLVYRGGKIGLHGYTHQYGGTKSGEGYEFGEDCPFSDIECINRMLNAKKIARDLGYEISFFEFPHYASTPDQERYAEKYFDVIYQQDRNVITKGYIVNWTRSDGRVIKYVPTPADYLYSSEDISNMRQRMKNCIKNGMLLSLFYHPRLDFKNIQAYTSGNVRICTVKENTLIYSLVDEAVSNNFMFSLF